MPSKATISHRRSSSGGGLKGLQDRMDRASRSGQRYVKVGLPAGSNPYPDGTSVIMVGTVHEFGDESGNIPERSFLRAGLDQGADRLNEIAAKIARGVLSGEKDALQGLELLGTEAASIVASKIVSLRNPPNAPSTLKAKEPKTNPLIETSHLHQSITHQVVDKK